MGIQFDPDHMPVRGSVILLDRKKAVDDPEREELQLYMFRGWTPHTTKTGEDSAVMSWFTRCNECNVPFGFKTGLNTRAFVRRCPKCRKASKRSTGGWPEGPRIRHTLLPPPEKRPAPALEAVAEIDPASLF